MAEQVTLTLNNSAIRSHQEGPTPIAKLFVYTHPILSDKDRHLNAHTEHERASHAAAAKTRFYSLTSEPTEIWQKSFRSF